MGKIMVFTVLENEENILSDISEYLKMKGSYAGISSVQGTILAFPNFEIHLYRREVRQNQKVIKLTDLEFRILYYLACQPGRVFTYSRYVIFPFFIKINSRSLCQWLMDE